MNCFSVFPSLVYWLNLIVRFSVFFLRTHKCTHRSVTGLHRSTGKLYGGQLNATVMGIYLVDKQLLNIFYKDTTIIRRLNVHGISIRTMVVVSVCTHREKERATTTKALSTLHHTCTIAYHQTLL